MNASLLSSERMTWNTPENVLERVRCLGRILLDPCSNADSIVGAIISFDEKDDGLSLTWNYGGRGVCFVNPPYGREIVPWIDKMVKEAEGGVEIVALVPARVETKWFAKCWDTADAICFWRGRLTFLGAPAGAPFPSALVYWGEQSERFQEVFCTYGHVVTR